MSRRGPRRWAAWLALLAAAVAVGIAAEPRGRDGPPLDPRATGPLGTRALVLLLEELGGRVDVTDGVPRRLHDVALVLADDLDGATRDGLDRWVRGGGTLVVADPRSPLNPFGVAGPVAIGPLSPTLERRCDLDALREVERVDPAGGLLYEVPAGATGCFRRGGGAWLAATSRGDGLVVALGGAGALVNANLGEEDNAVLAAALLAPARGAAVALLRPPPPGSGSESLLDLVSPGTKQALVQIGVAFALLALWRARRLGRPVVEPDPVQVGASELVVAMGNLLHQAGRRDQAAARIGDDVRRRLAARLGLGSGAPAEQVAAVAAARAGLDEQRVLSVLAPGPLPGEDALVRHAREAEAVHEEVVHA